MKEIIENMKHLSEYDKEMLGDIFDNLYEYQKKFLDEIVVKTEKQFAESKDSPKWKIVTALIGKSEAKKEEKNGLYEILDTNCFKEKMCYADLEKIENSNGRYSAGVAFLICKYHDVDEYKNKRYKAYVTTENASFEVEYYFNKYEGYREKEKIVEKTAMQYEVDVPIILEPFSRRAVNVVVNLSEHNISKSDNVNIDFQLQKNGLSDVIKQDATIVWNVEIIDENDVPKPREMSDMILYNKVTPLFSKVYKIFEFSAGENEFYYIDSKIQDVKRYKQSVYINMNEAEDIKDVRYTKMVLHDVPHEYLEKMMYCFKPVFDDECIKRTRIRTEADIDFAMNTMNNDVARYCGLCRKAEENKVYTYSSFDKYYYPKKEILRSASICYVRFEKSDNIFFEDYVSHILSYMNYYYPEFYWVGVV